MISTLALFIAVQTPAQAPALVGKWTGHYQFTDNNDQKEYHFDMNIAENDDVSGTYDFGDWRSGKVHGNVKDNGEYKIFFKYGNQESWAQIVGKFSYDEKEKALADAAAVHSFPTPDPDVRKRHPKAAKVSLKRPS